MNDFSLQKWSCMECVHEPKEIAEYPCCRCKGSVPLDDDEYEERDVMFEPKLTAQIPDNVNSPSHYNTEKFECIEVMREVMGAEAVENFCICNAFKYLWRFRRKNGVEDIKKAKWYLETYLESKSE